MSDRRPVRDEKRGASVAERRAQSLLKVSLSPSFPTGAFAYSHGLEKAVENTWVTDRETLEAWLVDLIEVGSLSNDLVLVTATWQATTRQDWATLRSATAIAAAMQPSRERELEATQQGMSFLAQIETAWPYEGATWENVGADLVAPYPVAVGYAAARHAIPLVDVLDAFGLAFITNLASAAIRLSVIGQTDGQRIVAALTPRLLSASESAARATLDDLGSATWLSDLASLQHETQHTRLFRS
ncbi:MAG TPA: urease accessory protein UreF [Hyphomicrobiaceae bacterium]|nr:urease accessory protein UreF [Hyphomicrobiaceae bacterium]